jgi:hypothetical protein
MQQDTEKLHKGMQEVVDKRGELLLPLSHYITAKGSPFYEGLHINEDFYGKEYREYLAILTNGVDIPLPSYTYIFAFTQSPITPDSPYILQLQIPSSNHRNFWLSVIVGGMFLCYREQPGIFVRRCVAPDCQKYFIPADRSHDQQFHSKTCQKRHYMRKYRK